jgi:DNA-cytosine methyltransferase
MTHASLFSGIGGFDLAAEWMGWQNVFNCEIDPFCRKVLAYHFPEAKQYEDVKTTDFTIHRGNIDVLTGGFPCQPFSLAGKRKGSDDNRYLWPEMLRAIREIKPRWVVGENVFGIVNWSDGMVFEQVQSDLEDEGYEVQPYIIPACAVDAPHRRDRVWFVAHRCDTGSEILQRERPIGIRESAVPADTPCNGWGGRGLNKDVQSNGTSFYRTNRKGVRHGVNLSDVLASGLLPTVKAQDCRHALHDRAKSNLGEEIAETFGDGTSQNPQLNPLFVAEMMGFPTDWTLAPFLNGLKLINDGDSVAGGAENPSKPTAMQ